MLPTQPLASIERLLRSGSFAEALRLAQVASLESPRSVHAWLALTHANFGLGRLVAADAAMKRAVALGARGDEVQLQCALIDHRLGRSDRAILRLRPLCSGGPAVRTQASLALADVLHRSGRIDELQDFVRTGGEWLADPRSVLARTRVLHAVDPAAAHALLEDTARSDQPPRERRVAGFEAVRLLDAAGEYRRAFELAGHLHATTSTPFDLPGVLADAQRQLELLRGPTGWCKALAPPVRGVAFVVGIPRSGTTLLEQMLDRHPAIGGIGEYEGILELGNRIVAEGLWPARVGEFEPGRARTVQRTYLQGAATLRRPGTSVQLDKTLHAWRWLPAIAAVLPGATGIRIVRNARDTAISLYLSNFNPIAFGWTGSLDAIREVLRAERELSPLALESLAIPHECIAYEDLVAEPRVHAARVLARLGLPVDDRVFSPHENTRTVMTLSHAQVRRPINAASIGRWRNYAFAFDQAWDAFD